MPPTNGIPPLLPLRVAQELFRLVPAAHEKIFQEQEIYSGGQECGERLLGRVDDGLTLNVETGVKDHFPTCLPSHGLQQRVKFRVIVWTTVCTRAVRLT